MELFTEIERLVGEEYVIIPVTVQFIYHRAVKGARDSLWGKRGAGALLEPDEPEEVVIEAVYDSNTKEDITLTKAEERWVLARCWKKLDDMASDI